MASSINLADIEPADYFTHSRTEMLAFLPESAGTVLDVGCGEGMFGSLVKQKLHAEVWGIELDRRAATIAQDRIDSVLCGDIGQLLEKLPDAYFDCVIFNDILEHLVDPFAILAKMKGKISRCGVIVCSIPNVRYFYTLKELLVHKQWQYGDHGVLDRTHLRFFTRNSIGDMFRSLGYEILILQGINPLVTWKYHLLNLLTCGYLEDCRYVQFACVVKPE